MVDAKGFFIGTCQYNFGTSPHAQCALVGIQCFSREFLALLQYEFIQIGQDGGVKADAVFHQQDELHTHFVDVVLQVHLVLYQLDDGNQQVGVSQPAEHILKGTEVFIGNTLGDAVAERGKYHHRNLFIQVFDVSCHVEAVVVSRARHADDEVERDGGQLCQRLLASGNLRETGRVAQGERSVFIEYLFVDAAVIFQHESIVRIGYQKDVENAPCHEVGKLCVLEIELV